MHTRTALKHFLSHHTHTHLSRKLFFPTLNDLIPSVVAARGSCLYKRDEIHLISRWGGGWGGGHGCQWHFAMIHILHILMQQKGLDSSLIINLKEHVGVFNLPRSEERKRKKFKIELNYIPESSSHNCPPSTWELECLIGIQQLWLSTWMWSMYCWLNITSCSPSGCVHSKAFVDYPECSCSLCPSAQLLVKAVLKLAAV